MTIPCEYTEWYLTTSGWIRGNSKRESDSVYRPEPQTALAKYEYVEKASADENHVECQTSLLWQKVERKDKIDQLIAMFGDCPEKL